MELSFFTMPIHPLGKPIAQSLKEDREAFILADRLGYAEAYCGEHSTDQAEIITSTVAFLAMKFHGGFTMPIFWPALPTRLNRSVSVPAPSTCRIRTPSG